VTAGLEIVAPKKTGQLWL